jgi:hypothetical protein
MRHWSVCAAVVLFFACNGRSETRAETKRPEPVVPIKATSAATTLHIEHAPVLDGNYKQTAPAINEFSLASLNDYAGTPTSRLEFVRTADMHCYLRRQAKPAEVIVSCQSSEDHVVFKVQWIVNCDWNTDRKSAAYAFVGYKSTDDNFYAWCE